MPDGPLLGLLILFPFAAAIIAWLIPGHSGRSVWVWICAALMAILSLMLLAKGTVKLDLMNSGGVSALIGILDVILLLFFLYVGIQARSWVIGIFSLAQLIPFVWLEWFSGHHAEVTPTFIADPLAITMVLIISIIGSVICIYATRYMAEHEEHLHLQKSRTSRFMFMMLFFLGAMNGLVLSNNLLWVYFFWEVTTLICYQLIIHDLTPIAIINARRALWMNLIGGAAFVIGIILASTRQPHTLSLDTLAHTQAIANHWPVLLPVFLLCLAAFSKAAQPPFHGWLLGAMVAPTPVSALLHSSTMVKAGVYLVLRLAPAFQNTQLSLFIAVFGGFVLLITAIMAFSQSNAKKVLAYSTIGNLGLIFLCAGVNTPLALTAGIILVLFHAVSKALLFMSVGAIEGRIGSRDIEDMEGLCSTAPALTGILVVGVLSMIAPPFGVLVGKWAALEAGSDLYSRWSFLVVILLALGSSVTVVFWVKWLARVLSALPELEYCERKPLPAAYNVSLWGLVILVCVLSAVAAPLAGKLIVPAVSAWYSPRWYGIANINATAAWSLDFGSGYIPLLFLVILGLLFLLVPALTLKIQKERVKPVYLCGENIEYQPSWKGLAD
ncbi:MAG: proton-conducting transporter membrane subunit, partial [bacterium]